MKLEIQKEHRRIVQSWRKTYYVPPILAAEMTFGASPEVIKMLDLLPENRPCEECSKRLWNCTCMVELDGVVETSI